MSLTRSQQMARIRQGNTKPELRLRKALWRRGLRYRIHYATPVGRPDIVFPGSKVAIFVDGCQWHGCPLHYVSPRTNRQFWNTKLTTNVERDQRQTLQLEETGWQVVRLWEHQIFTDLEGCLSAVQRAMERTYVPRAEWRVWKVQPLGRTGDWQRVELVQLRNPARQRELTEKRTTTKWRQGE